MNIGIVGTGLMGTALGEVLLAWGHGLIVYNRTTEKARSLVARGARLASSVAEVLDTTDAAVFVLPGIDTLRDVVLDAAVVPHLAGKRLLNVSTTLPDEIVALARDVARHGGNLAEVSIMVDSESLRSNRGEFLLGCDPGVTALWTGVLEPVGAFVARAGQVGDASKAEAPVLMASVFGLANLAFAAAVAQKAGLPPGIVAKYVGKPVAGLESMLPRMLARRYDDIFASVDNYAIVTATAIASARSMGVPTAVLESIEALLAEASARGLGSKDGSSVCEVLLEPGLTS